MRSSATAIVGSIRHAHSELEATFLLIFFDFFQLTSMKDGDSMFRGLVFPKISVVFSLER